MICHVPGYGRKRDDINIQRQVVWIAKALNAPQYRVFVVMMRDKNINGRKRHILVDTMGLLLTVFVTIASVQDRGGARSLLGNLPGCCKKLRKIWVDGGYTGQLLEWVVARFKFSLAVVPRPKQTRKFVLLPRRWVVERTFSWLNNCRRLSKSYERLTRTDEAWVYISMSRIMLNRRAQNKIGISKQLLSFFKVFQSRDCIQFASFHVEHGEPTKQVFEN